MNEHDFQPGWASPPGETIADIVAERRWSADEFAQRIGQPSAMAKALLSGEVAITKELAGKLAAVVGSSTTFWLARDEQYRASLAKMRSQFTTQSAKTWIAAFPVAEMTKLGWIPTASSDPTVKATACLQFFGVADVNSWQESYGDVFKNVAFRASATFKSDPFAVAAWLRQGELEAAKLPTKQWNADAFRKALVEIRALTRVKDPAIFLPKLRALCAACGVAVIVLKAPPKCRASGAVQSLPRDRRLMLLSGRYLSDDHFWFTFFHEAGHLLLHGREGLMLEGLDAIPLQLEVEANTFAADFLIPPEHRDAMLSLPVELRKVMRFAKDLDIAPGIVVGQLQHFGHITRKQLNGLKQRYRWETGDDYINPEKP